MTNTERFFDALETLVELGGEAFQDDIEYYVAGMDEAEFQAFTPQVVEACNHLTHFLRNGLASGPRAKKRQTAGAAR